MVARGEKIWVWKLVCLSMLCGAACWSGPKANSLPFSSGSRVTGSIAPQSVTSNQISPSITDVIPPNWFGMHLIDEHSWPTVPVGALGKGAGVTWANLEPQRGVFNWSGMDRWISAATSHGVTIFYANDGLPQWATSNTSTCFTQATTVKCTAVPSNIQDWDDFVTALVTRYKGQIFMYELWNEPSDQGTGMSVNDMVTMTTDEYNIIRSIDPQALIAAPSGLYPGYMSRYFAAGGPKGVDIVTLHGTAQTAEDLLPIIANVRSVMAQYGLSSKPLWATEGGTWGNRSLSSSDQVAFVGQVQLLYWAQGIGRKYWYAWDSGVWGTLWTATTGITGAGIAYGQVYNWMVGATMTTPCARDASSTWTCGFSRAGGYQALAIWNSTTSLLYKPAGIYVQYRDMFGNVHPTSPNTSIPIGSQPILLETSSLPAAPVLKSITVQ